MIFTCKLCNDWSLTRYICEDCNKIKDMINLYERDVVIDVLEAVLVRDTIKRNYKIDMIKKKGLDTPPKDNNSILCDTSNDREYKKEENKKEKIDDSIVLYKNVADGMITELKEKLTKL